MFHYTPASRLPSSYSYSPAPVNNPRDRYLAALAEAKAAEADFLTAEAAQREEDDLRRRLEEIQHRKQEQLFRSPYDRAPFDPYPSYGRLAGLHQQVEAEERLRLVALREAEAAERRREVEVARQIEASRQIQAHVEARRRRQQEEKEQARLAALLEQSTKVAHHHCSCGNQASQPSCRKQQSNPALHPILRALLAPEDQDVAAKPKQVQNAHDFVGSFLAPLLRAQPETSQPQAPTPAPTRQAPPKPATYHHGSSPNPEQFLEHLFKSLGFSVEEVQPSAPQVTTPSTAATSEHLENDILQQLANLLNPAATKQTTSQPTASTSSSKPVQPAQEPPAKAEAVPSAPAPTAAPAKAPSAVGSLKEQLESRLNNEFHSEVRDTIQAIFASLQDVEQHLPSAPSNKAATSGKGKAKAEPSSATTPTPASDSTAPTSKDVVNSLNEVRSIETAFRALESDFTFPATLDFIAAHLVAGSPASSDSESSSATTHLAYTSRNHPVRFYEQALGALLAQLDSVDSFGNDTLRANRKEVVGRVEKALEELEKEVEGRYRTRLSKEAKAAPSEAETTTVPEVPAPAPSTTSEPTDVTPIPEIEVEATPETSSTTSTSEETPYASQPSESSTISESASPVEPAAPADIPSIADESPTSISSSTATVKGYEIETEEDAVAPSSPAVSEPADTFLFPPAEATTLPKRPANKDSDDVASDWSEVEA
ncbi:hypothetical protein DXG01_004223 [Tephrocybe rancida]|nr:hypothetical protein DXG01_004223 [Tephrocybe rancida]